MADRIRILLADNLTLTRQGIKALLSAMEDMEVVGEAASVDEVVRLAQELQPDVVLMDSGMPGNSLHAVDTIKEANPRVEIIMMTDRLNDGKALQAIEVGVTGYVLKDIPITSLVAAVHSVCNGQAYFHPEITRKLMERLGRLTREQRDWLRLGFEGMTTRELGILIELAEGSTDREIAAKYMVSEGTVKTHIRNILSKLGARNRTQAVAHVLRKGVID